MINIKKFGYTTSNLFTLTGSTYIGYYNINDGKAYAGKYTQEVLLGNYENISNVFVRSDLFLNRLPFENFTLTYNLSDFTFQSGEFINSNSFDNKLQKAFTNYLDTFRACFMASSKLPYNLTAVAQVSSTYQTNQIVWAGSTKQGSTIQSLSAFNSVFTPECKIEFIKGDNTNLNTLVIAGKNTLLVYRTQLYSTFALAFSSSYIETNTPEYGSLTFSNITDISTTGNNLYVCDNGNSTVYSYDITSVIQNDRALGYKFNLTNSVDAMQGGFVSPKLVCSSPNTIFIYDNILNTVLYFDTNFNLKNSYRSSSLFSVSTPVSMTYYKLYNQLFILTSDYKIVVLDGDANATVIEISTDSISPGESPLNLIFSNSNSDVFYLLTTQNLFKKFVSNIYGNIGNYSFSQGITGINTTNTGNVLYDVSIQETNNDVDNILLYGFGQFINYQERTVFNSILT